MSDINFCEKTTFCTVCKVLEQIYCGSSREKKVEIMKQFISSFREQSKNHQDVSFYPIMRLLLPHLERERGPYGIKEHTLANTYIRILCLSKTGKDAQKLMHYKTPRATVNNATDFAEVAYWILRSRFSNGETLNVYQVNLHLDNIATKHAEHDPRGVDAELQSIIMQMSPLEQKWLIRILLKDLRLGISHGKILNLFHQDANDLFDVTNNLQKICTTLKNPSIRLNEIEVTLFQPFKPMLCQQCDIQSVDTNIKKAEFYYVEIKYDGERFQLHYQNGDFRYFSRNGYEYTNTYGCNSSNGILTPKLAKCLSSKVKSCILDGEMMCWNTRRKLYTTKGMNIDVKTLKIGHVNQPCYCVFDILYLNGDVLTNKPLTERVQILEEIIQSQEGVMVNSNRDTVKSSDQIINLLKLVIDNCEEGIVVKDPFAVYKPNSRNAGWYKIKPEYTDGLMVELDVIILGGYYGEGRRRGVISQFLLGLADSRKNEDNEPSVFYSFGRVGSGCTDEELAELERKLQSSWQKVKLNQMPPRIQWAKEKPDLWIEPQSSCILQVKATEVIPSDSFKVGYTLRFPRIQKIRYDKPWSDCLTVDEFKSIRNSYNGKLTVNYAAKLSESPKRKVKRTKNTLSIDSQFQFKKTKNIEMLSTLFENREFCIITGLEESISKNEFETKIMQNGGTVVQHPGAETFCVIASEITARVSNVIRLNKYNIIKPEWVLRCIEKGVIHKWRPDDFLAMNLETSKEMSKEYDRFGDSYKEPIDINRLKQLLDSMEVDENVRVDVKDMIELDRMLFEDSENPYAIFRGCFAYFCVDTKDDSLNHGDMYREIFKFYGGCEQRDVDMQTTHVISFVNELPVEVKELVSRENILVVNKNWISESSDANSRLSETTYAVKIT